MSNVVVCYKWVIDEADLRVAADLTVSTSRATMKISDYDRNAIQLAVETAAALDGKAYGLSYGDGKVKKSIKEALARGLDELVWVNDENAAAADSFSTANALAEAVASMEDVALLIASDGSSDQFSRQTAPRLAALLGWPVVTCVKKM